MPESTEISGPFMPAADVRGQSSGRIVLAVQQFAAQYAAAILTALVVATCFFPDNAFLPVPWQHDDYHNLANHLRCSSGHRIEWFCTRPVSTNAIWYLGSAGETTYYMVMFLLAALLPVLAVRLALRLFRCRPGPWLELWLTVAVAFCTFLFEESPWFYRYTGLMTNMTSAITGLLAAYSFCRFLDGKKFAFVLGGMFSLATAFAKEDMLLFVPLFVTIDWCILRAGDKRLSRFRPLILVYAVLAAVAAMLVCWNKWIVPSPFTAGTAEPYKLNASLAHIFEQIGKYASHSQTPRTVFIALGVTVGLGLLRRGHRLAAVGSILLPLSLILPYTILPRYFAYYWLNWLSISVAFALVGIAVAWRALAPGRLATLPWIVPVLVMAASVLSNHTATANRRELTELLNLNQANNRYIILQVLRHREEFAQAETVAVVGLENVFSPWYLTDGRYINWKLGREIHWLLLASPTSNIAKHVKEGRSKIGQVQIVSERELAAYPGVPILEFDKDQNLTVKVSARH
jgi:hypothetical protein